MGGAAGVFRRHQVMRDPTPQAAPPPGECSRSGQQRRRGRLRLRKVNPQKGGHAVRSGGWLGRCTHVGVVAMSFIRFVSLSSVPGGAVTQRLSSPPRAPPPTAFHPPTMMGCLRVCVMGGRGEGSAWLLLQLIVASRGSSSESGDDETPRPQQGKTLKSNGPDNPPTTSNKQKRMATTTITRPQSQEQRCCGPRSSAAGRRLAIIISFLRTTK